MPPHSFRLEKSSGFCHPASIPTRPSFLGCHNWRQISGVLEGRWRFTESLYISIKPLTAREDTPRVSAENRARAATRASFLTIGEFALDLAFAETANQMIACADRQRHHGKGRVLARRRHKARSVHHEQIFHVVRLVERIEH